MRAGAILPSGTWEAAREVDCVLIDFDHRYRRRIVLRTQAGAELLVDLPQAARLRHGDGLVLDQGGIVRVCSRPEQLLDIHAHGAGELARIAWHLGNRHLPMQLTQDRIRIRADHVIEAMVQALGGHVEPVTAAFDPEPGAYAGGHRHHGDDERDPHGH